MMETQSIAGPVILVAAGIGVPTCLFAAFIVGIGGISGTRDPLFAALLALGAVGFPVVGMRLLCGKPTIVRSIAAVILGSLPLTFVVTVIFRIF